MAAPYDGLSNKKGVPGLRGENTAGGDGVWGEADAKPTAGRGVVGVSDSGTGVWGDTQTGRAVVGVVRTSGDAVWGETKSGRGVVGVVDGDGTGVWGDIKTGRAVVGVVGAKGDAVWGETRSGRGVVGVSDADGVGVFGTSQQSEGVRGETNAGFWMGAVAGFALNSNGGAAGVLGQANGTGPGVFGKGRPGVMGFHGDPKLQETTVANDSDRAGVFGASDVGVGVLGYSSDRNTPAIYAFGGFRSIALGKPLAGLFDGDVQVNGDIFLPGADCAEQFDIAAAQQIEPGSVVVLDQDGLLTESREAYDRKVAGVVSGAGSYRPAIVLDKQATPNGRQPIALVGKVYCKIDAEYAPVGVGDLLTTSPTPGHAMKADDPAKAFGAVIGKALGRLSFGRGLLPILVALQ